MDLFSSCVSTRSGQVPSDDRRRSLEIEEQLTRDKKQYMNTHRVLLLGAGESGKSTVVKQMKILHMNGYSDAEKREFIPRIIENIQNSLLAIIGAMGKLEPKINFENEENEKHKEFLLSTASDFGATELAEEKRANLFAAGHALWKDKGIQKTFVRRNEYQLPDSGEYYLNELSEIEQPDYLPSEQDILRCRTITTKILETRFEVNRIPFHMFDVGGQRDQRRRWIQCFDGVTAIMYVAACSEYDMVLTEDDDVNRLRESVTLLGNLWNNKWLMKVSFILFINKVDLLERKLSEELTSIETFFPEYVKFQRNETSKLERCKNFVKNLYLEELTKPENKEKNHDMHSYYPHFTCAIDTNNISKVFQSCRNIIRSEHLRRFSMS